jgi:xylulokinase
MGGQVHVPAPGEYVALGAARQAAWALRGGEAPPSWQPAGTLVVETEPSPQVRERYAAVRAAAYGG